MFRKINEMLFHFIAKKHLDTHARERRFVNYSKAKTVFILFESDYLEKNKDVRQIINSLQQDGKKVVAWGFIDKKNVTTSLMPDFRILNHEQANFFDIPKQTFIRELLELEFDLMIDLTPKPMIPLQYFSLYTKALCKVGIRKNDLQMYDFILDVENVQTEFDESDEPMDQSYLYNQIIFYLKNIQTSD